jgi:hypothetical protein
VDIFLNLFLLISNRSFTGHFNDLLRICLLSIFPQTIVAENFNFINNSRYSKEQAIPGLDIIGDVGCT